MPAPSGSIPCERYVAVALVRFEEVATIALEECARRTTGAVRPNRAVGVSQNRASTRSCFRREQGAGRVAYDAGGGRRPGRLRNWRRGGPTRELASSLAFVLCAVLAECRDQPKEERVAAWARCGVRGCPWRGAVLRPVPSMAQVRSHRSGGADGRVARSRSSSGFIEGEPESAWSRISREGRTGAVRRGRCRSGSARGACGSSTRASCIGRCGRPPGRTS